VASNEYPGYSKEVQEAFKAQKMSTEVFDRLADCVGKRQTKKAIEILDGFEMPDVDPQFIFWSRLLACCHQMDAGAHASVELAMTKNASLMRGLGRWIAWSCADTQGSRAGPTAARVCLAAVETVRREKGGAHAWACAIGGAAGCWEDAKIIAGLAEQQVGALTEAQQQTIAFGWAQGGWLAATGEAMAEKIATGSRMLDELTAKGLLSPDSVAHTLKNCGKRGAGIPPISAIVAIQGIDSAALSAAQWRNLAERARRPTNRNVFRNDPWEWLAELAKAGGEKEELSKMLAQLGAQKKGGPKAAPEPANAAQAKRLVLKA
jgi:hypothetical protein